MSSHSHHAAAASSMVSTIAGLYAFVTADAVQQWVSLIISASSFAFGVYAWCAGRARTDRENRDLRLFVARLQGEAHEKDRQISRLYSEQTRTNAPRPTAGEDPERP